MVKAQSFFGGTKPKDSATKAHNMGHTGQVQSKTTSLPVHEDVKQAKSNPVSSNITWVNSKQVGSTGSAK